MQQYQQQMDQWQQAVQKAQEIQGENQQHFQEFMAAVDLIRREALHAFAVEVSSDSLKALDEADDQMQRLNFLKTIFPMLQQTLPMISGNPDMGNLVKELVLLGVRGFPIARSVEDVIEEAIDSLAKQPAGPPPSAQDDMIKAQSQQQEAGSRIQVAQIQAATQQLKSQADIQMAQDKLKGDQMEQAQNMNLKAQSQASEENFRRMRAEALQMRMMRGLGGAA
jgi:hypothetical protein